MGRVCATWLVPNGRISPLSKNWVFPRREDGGLADRNLHLFIPFLSTQRPGLLEGRVGWGAHPLLES